MLNAINKSSYLLIFFCLFIKPFINYAYQTSIKSNVIKNSFSVKSNTLLDDWIDQNTLLKQNNFKNIKFIFDAKNGCYISKAATLINRGETVATVPLSICIDSPNVLKKYKDISIKSFRTGSYGVLALFILNERLKNDKKSIYYGYINSLPREVKSNQLGVFNWNDNLIDEFSKSTTRDFIKQIEAANEDYEFILNNKYILSDELNLFSKDLFLWALSIVKSRSIVTTDGNVIMIPGLDFIEYDPFSTAEPIIASDGFFGGKIVKVIAEQTYQVDDKIVMSYGLKSSAECLEDHGIIPDIALDDSCCELTVSIDGSEKFSDDKLNVLENFEIPTKFRVDLEANPNSDIDPALIQFLRLKFIQGTDAYILESCFSQTVYETLNFPFSKSNEINVYEYLNNFCENKLNLLNELSTNELDQALVNSSQNVELSVVDNIKLSLAKLRIQERAALRNTLTKISAELKTLKGGVDPREYYQDRRLRELNLLRPPDEDEIVL